MRALLLILLLLPLPLRAEEIVLGLSRSEVSITATFDGSDILIFGAIKRDASEPDGDLGIIVTIAGPEQEVTVRRKARWGPIWVNSESVIVDEAPTFYAVASSAPLDEILSATDDLRFSITIPEVIRAVGTNVIDSRNFQRALIRIRAGNDLYQLLEGEVALVENTLFRTRVELPANLTEGEYDTRILLTRDRRIIDTYETVIPVRKVGLERWLFRLAHDQPVIYGLMSLAIAISAGWLASAAFNLLRR